MPAPVNVYTVYSPHGTVLGENLNANGAADAILTYGGHQYAVIRAFHRGPKAPCYYLYVSKFPRTPLHEWQPGMVVAHCNGGLQMHSFKETAEQAWDDLAQQVLAANWHGMPKAVPAEQGTPNSP